MRNQGESLLNEVTGYLENSLGIEATVSEWDETESLPLFIRGGCTIGNVTTKTRSFILVDLKGSPSLPDIKRAYTQVSRRAAVPVVVSYPWLNARQRHALVEQGIPFACAGKQAFLPFLGMASTEWGSKKTMPIREGLTPKAQQAALWGALTNKTYSMTELRLATGMSPSQASDAVNEIVRREMAAKTKSGKQVLVSPVSIEELLDKHMAELSSPVIRTLTVRRSPSIDALPDAGETALATRSMLNAPPIVQKAASKQSLATLRSQEILQGECPDSEIAVVQLWRYSPLFTGHQEIDNVSLALSLAKLEDERVIEAIDSLFGKEYVWDKAL